MTSDKNHRVLKNQSKKGFPRQGASSLSVLTAEHDVVLSKTFTSRSSGARVVSVKVRHSVKKRTYSNLLSQPVQAVNTANSARLQARGSRKAEETK